MFSSSRRAFLSRRGESGSRSGGCAPPGRTCRRLPDRARCRREHARAGRISARRCASPSSRAGSASLGRDGFGPDDDLVLDKIVEDLPALEKTTDFSRNFRGHATAPSSARLKRVHVWDQSLLIFAANRQSRGQSTLQTPVCLSGLFRILFRRRWLRHADRIGCRKGNRATPCRAAFWSRDLP